MRNNCILCYFAPSDAGLRAKLSESAVLYCTITGWVVILFVSVNELCVHVPKEFSMWNDIQHSQLRLGSCNWLDLR